MNLKKIKLALLGLTFFNSATGHSSWYCSGECRVTQKHSNLSQCDREHRESCERSGATFDGPNHTPYGPQCYCYKYEYGKYSISSTENTQWLAQNQLSKQCDDKSDWRKSIWYSQHGVTCKFQ